MHAHTYALAQATAINCGGSRRRSPLDVGLVSSTLQLAEIAFKVSADPSNVKNGSFKP
jgi:hypothetical protein